MAPQPSRTDDPSPHLTAAERLLDAMCAREFGRAAGCLDEEAVLRAVLPPRVLEASGREEIVGWFRRWFEPAQVFDVVDRSHTNVAGRDRVTWRFQVGSHPGIENPADHLIEQILFCDERSGSITAIDLLCSGFRPVHHAFAG